jgi:hypothetical protein
MLRAILTLRKNGEELAMTTPPIAAILRRDGDAQMGAAQLSYAAWSPK